MALSLCVLAVSPEEDRYPCLVDLARGDSIDQRVQAVRIGSQRADGKGAHAAYEQIYYSSLVPRTYLCARLLETLD